MADYSYRISAGASNVAPNFTTINGAVADAVANDRTGSGVNGRVAASSTLRFQIDGYLSSNGDTVVGIDTTTNANARIVVEPFSNAWNAAPRAIGATSAFAGIDFGSNGQLALGNPGAFQRNVLVRNLALRTNVGTFGVIDSRGASDGINEIEGCLLLADAASGATGARLYATNIRNCAILLRNTSGAGGVGIESSGGGGAPAVNNCTLVSFGTSAALVLNQGDPLPIFRNSYAGGFTSFAASGTFSGSCVGNATSQASGWTGTTGTLFSVALSTTNFENVTSGTEDLRAKVASALKTTGAARLSTVLTDVFGTSRADPTTIGAFEPAGAAPVITGDAPLDGPTASGGMSSQAPSTLSGGATLDGPTAGGGLATAPGVLTSGVLKRNGGEIAAGVTLDWLTLLVDGTGAFVATKTAVAVNGSGIFSVPDAGMLPGTIYRAVWKESTGQRGHGWAAAA